jgi:hypothetical protein
MPGNRDSYRISESAPVAARSGGPQSADRSRARDERADAPVSQASLHDARIVRPLHCINDRVETCSHQVAQMSSPAVFALHAHSDSQVVDSTLAGKSQFLVLRPVISTLYCRNLATDAEKCLFSLRTALHITCGESVTTIDQRQRAGFRALHMASILPTTLVQGNWP